MCFSQFQAASTQTPPRAMTLDPAGVPSPRLPDGSPTLTTDPRLGAAFYSVHVSSQVSCTSFMNV